MDPGACCAKVEPDDEPRRVLPVSGTLVVYDSTTEHEVLETRRERVLISGRFKELDEDGSGALSGVFFVVERL